MLLKKSNRNKTERIHLRCSKQELNRIKTKANIYTDGNISEFLIFAALNYIPNKDDFDENKGPNKS